MLPNKGDRIRFLSTTDPFIKIPSGTLGIVTDVTPGNDWMPAQIWVQWDTNAQFALVQGQDRYEILPKEEPPTQIK